MKIDRSGNKGWRLGALEGAASKGDGMAKKNWIAGAIKKPGSLHKALGVPMGKKIPAAKMEAATHSKNPKTRKRANLAKTLKGFH